MKKICMSLILAAAMTTSAVPTVYAEDIVTVTTSVVPQQNVSLTTTTAVGNGNTKRMHLSDFYESAQNFSLDDIGDYKRMTIEDVYRDINGGDYINIGSWNGLTMDENGDLHIIDRTLVATVIKVKEGFDNYPVFKNAQYKPDVIIDGQYIIIRIRSVETINEYVDSVRDDENILSIERYYGIYEDTGNHSFIDGFGYNGEELTDEKLAEYPALLLAPLDQRSENFDHYLSTDMNRYTGDRKEIYNEMKKLYEEFPSLYPTAIQTCVALETPDYYFCIETDYVDGLSGDANIDGAMDISDSVLVMQSLANPSKYGVTGENGITSQGIKNADSDGNGITNADALTIQKKLLKLS